MTIFDTIGEAQLLREEGNRILARALAGWLKTVTQRLGQFFNRALDSKPTRPWVP
jgi:hypothetical protein